MRFKSDFREERLYSLWENFCKSKSWSNDLRLQGLHAGKLNLFEGPDFQGAEFELDGKIYHGDVEIHRYTNDWYHHHHHLDRRYDSVQLHLVWHQQPDISIYTSDKRTIMTMDIKKLPGSLKSYKNVTVCRLSQISSEILRDKLKILSLNRLNYKIARVKDLVNRYSYDQTIFIMLMRILGSPNNVTNFEYLASLLSWEKMTEFKNRYHLPSDFWLKFYLHLSGLKPLKLNEREKKDFIQFSNLINNMSPISYFNWYISGQRPHNSPEHHLKILAYWFSQLPYDSLYLTLKEIISQRLSERQLLLKLYAVFSHGFSIPNKPGNTDISKKLSPHWGKATITEIIGNVVLPFFYWEALKNLSFGFQKYLEEFFFTLPQLNQYAELEKIKKSVLKGKALENKFYIHQGLLYLLHSFCRLADCQLCPLTVPIKDIDKEF